MLVSIFTPSHDTRFLPEVYKSLAAQTDPNWEWIILYNHDGEPVDIPDPRVKHHRVYGAPEWVGPLKAAACELAEGEILLELDHDDLLHPEAVRMVREAFASDPEIGFVYSNTVHAMGDMTPVQRFDERYGWKFREVEWDGHKLDEHIHFPPNPDCVSKIWFAPNHLRAFRAHYYRTVGGYNKEMRILDDLDLMCRLYSVCKFHHIDAPLYLYRVHGQNTWLRYNEEIQANVFRIHDQYIETLAERFADLNGVRKLELGGRWNTRSGYESVDIKDADILADLNGPWPFENNSVGVIRAIDVLEHLIDPIHAMREISRILIPGGWAFIQVPSTDGRGAFQDPTHKSFWNQNSFFYYTMAEYARWIDTPVRFQAARLYTTPHTEDYVCWVVAHLVNCKDGYRPAGLLEI